MPSHSTRGVVEGLFTSPGDSHPRCPFSGQLLKHGNSENKFHFSHWIAKCLQSGLAGIELDDNTFNIVPTLDVVHTNIELHQRRPNLSLKFAGTFSNQYDEYTIVLNSALSMTHALHTALGGTKTVLIPVGSRPFVAVHYRVFCAHHNIPSSTPRITVAQDMSWFDQTQADLMFALTMMASPFVRELKKTAKTESKFAQPAGIQLNGYPERSLSLADARKLVGTTIKVSSELFPKWDVQPHLCNAFVVRHNAAKRSFNLIFPDEYTASEFELFHQQGWRIKGGQPDIKIYSDMKEAMLLRFMNPAKVLTLEKCYKAKRSPRQATSTSSENAPRKSAKLQGRSQARSSTSGVAEQPFSSGQRISVLFSTRWVEGVIVNTDGTVITVAYDDNEEREHSAAELKTYKLLAEPTGVPTGELVCVQCRLWHKQIAGPKDKICCSKCKVPSLVSCPERGGRLHATQHAAAVVAAPDGAAALAGSTAVETDAAGAAGTGADSGSEGDHHHEPAAATELAAAAMVAEPAIAKPATTPGI